MKRRRRSSYVFLPFVGRGTDGQMRQADMELKKGQNIIEHEAEIYARPARTWFQTEKEKQNAKGKLILPFSRSQAK